MTIEDILHHLEPGDELTVFNEPFSYKSKAVITLDGGDMSYWLFSDEENLLAVSPDNEEIVFFRFVEESLEPQDNIILFSGEEYELSYEDSGVVSEIEGELNAEEDDRFEIADYQAEDGNTVRLLSNETNGEVSIYFGRIVVEDDIQKH